MIALVWATIFQPFIMNIKELLLLHHTHTDIGYTHPQPVIWELHNRYLDEALDLCEQTAGWPEPCRMKWTCEVTGTFLHWLENAPEAQVRRLHALVRHGQISFGAMQFHWMLPLPRDLFIESLRSVQIIRERFGAPVSVAIQHDVNGIPWSAVDVLNDAGIPHLLMGINIHMGGFPLQRLAIFRWAGPLLGNGDVGVVLASLPPERQTFYIGKSGFWTRAPNNTKVINVARVELDIPSLRGASCRQEQDLAQAEVCGTFSKVRLTVRTQSWVDATRIFCWRN